MTNQGKKTDKTVPDINKEITIHIHTLMRVLLYFYSKY